MRQVKMVNGQLSSSYVNALTEDLKARMESIVLEIINSQKIKGLALIASNQQKTESQAIICEYPTRRS